MNASDLDSPEFPDAGDDFLADDAIPTTLAPLLRHIAEEVFPELDDCLAFLDEWVAREQPADGDPVAREAHQRRLGGVQTCFRGAPVQAGVQPYLIYLLRRVDRFIDGLEAAPRQVLEDYLASLGLARLRVGERGYSVGRRNNIEVWEIAAR